MRIVAYAKINLALQVGGRRADGFHSLVGLSQSVDLADVIALTPADADELVVSGGAPADSSNLAWQALAAARDLTGDRRPRRLALTKVIPARAGLGGGSADAAAVLGALASDVPPAAVRQAAAELGSDVPFSLVGGTAVIRGRGEIVEPLPFAGGYALAVAVPPLELPTGAVYRRFDELEAPLGPALPAAALPPVLRELAPLRNDLYPAAVAVAPELDDWRAELSGRWGVPVAMTGSGSGLFAFFPDRDEAVDAVRAVPAGARYRGGVVPVTCGWELSPATP